MERRTPAERRQQLVDAAAGVIAARGFARTRVGDIAAAAGVSVGLVHRYFPTLDDALAAAFAAVAERGLAAVDAHRGRPPRERLALLIEEPVGEAGQWAPVWIDAWGESLHRPELRATAAEYTRRWRAEVADALAAGHAAGEWSCPDAEDAAGRLVACMDGLALHLAVHPPPGGRATVTAWARRLVAAEVGPS